MRHYNFEIDKLPCVVCSITRPSPRLGGDNDHYRIVLTQHDDLFVECSKVDEINAMNQRTWATLYSSETACSVLAEAITHLVKFLIAAKHWKDDIPQVIWANKGLIYRVVLRESDCFPRPRTVVEQYQQDAMEENYWSELDVDVHNRTTSLQRALKEIIEFCANNKIKIY
jgi:hypothetical protein